MTRVIFNSKFQGMLTVACFILVWLCAAVFLLTRDGAAGEPPETAGFSEAKLLEGSWIRTDGGYVLELHNIANDGSLTASYFNPQSIKVFQSFWTTDEGALAVFIELRDVNYPGSKYSLRYDPAADRLQGRYFQAIEQQLYEIEFVRHR